MRLLNHENVTKEEWAHFYEIAVSSVSYRFGRSMAEEMINLLIANPQLREEPKPKRRMV